MPVSKVSVVRDPQIISLTLALFVPVLGVLLLGWDARAIMFILAWEIILSSATLTWLFNYPDRSTWRGVLFVVITMPVGWLFLLTLNMSYGDWRYGISEMSGDLFRVTWISLLFVFYNSFLNLNRNMAEARRRGASIERNNSIGVQLILSVYLPFLVFALLLAGWNSMGPWTLAGVLIARAAFESFTEIRRVTRQRTSQRE